MFDDIETKLEKQPYEKGTKFLAGVGVIALLLVVVWLGTQVIQLGAGLTSSLASSISGVRLFFGASEDIVLVANPDTLESDESFTLSWKHLDKKTDGSYTFNYECNDGVHLTSPESTNTGNVIFCNTPFPILSDKEQITLTAISINDESTDIVLSLDFIPNGEQKETAVGEEILHVVSDHEVTNETEVVEDGSQPEDIPSVQETPVVTIPVNNPNGTPDLVVNILEVGTVTTTGVFTKKTGSLNPSDRLAVRFEIKNIGNKDTGVWDFEAQLPTEQRYTFKSDKQETLLPGMRAEYTLGFEDAEDDDDTITILIEVDPSDNITEQSESNNSDSITVDINN